MPEINKVLFYSILFVDKLQGFDAMYPKTRFQLFDFFSNAQL